MGAQTRDYAVDVTIEDAGGVRDRLPDAELDVVLGQGGRRAAQPGDPDLERDARAVGRLLEEHGDVAPVERPLGPSAGLDRVGEVEDLAELGSIEIGQVDEVASLERSHWSDHDRLSGSKVAAR